MTDHSTLERLLRDASDPSVWDDVSPDAWQQNERRVAADGSGRASRRLRVVAAAAAAAVVVGGGAYVASRLGGPSAGPADRHSEKRTPDTTNQDPFADKNRVGKTVVLERYTAKGETVVHSAWLTRSGGKGLSLCDEYAAPGSSAGNAGNSGSGGCTAEDPDPSKPKLDIFGFVFGTDGETSEVHTVTGAVDRRVAAMRAWTGDDAQGRQVDLHALGVDGLRAFGVTTPAGASAVVRLVAYDAAGTALQVFDPSNYYGAEWLPDDDTCAQATPVAPQGERLVLGFTPRVSAAATSLLVQSAINADDFCVPAPKGRPTTVSEPHGGQIAIVTGPEVDAVQVRIGSGAPRTEQPQHFTGTAWGLVIVDNVGNKKIRVTATSAEGSALDATPYGRLPTD